MQTKPIGTSASVPKKSNLPRNVTEFFDRGRWRLQFRAKGLKTRYFKSRPGTDEFLRELAEFRNGDPAPKVRSALRTKPGSISALIAVYYGTPRFLQLAPSTKVTYRGVLERFRVAYGDLSVATLTKKHVRAIMASMSDRPKAANRLLDLLKSILEIAVDDDWRPDNPAARVEAYSREGTGFHSWTDAELAAYDARHPLGTKARLAKDLLYYTAQRRGDVILMCRQAGNVIRLQQGKTGARLEIPIHPELRRSIEACPSGHLNYLVTAKGEPFSAAYFGNTFREWCDEAGLVNCSAHGLRKAAARKLAEAGRSNQDIKALTGHRTDKEVSRYTAAADQRMRAVRAIKSLGPKRERKNVSR